MIDPIKFCNENYQGLPILINVIVTCIGAFFAWYVYSQKSKLEKEFERYKYGLQVESIKAEIRVKQISDIYPKMFLHFKQMEYELVVLVDPKTQRLRPIEQSDIDKARKEVLNVTNNYLASNLLFLSPNVRKTAIELKDVMGKALLSKTKEEREKNYTEVSPLIDKLERQMTEELHPDKNIK